MEKQPSSILENKSFSGRPKPGQNQSMTSQEDVFRRSGNLNMMRTSGTSFRPSSSSRDAKGQQNSQYSLNFIKNFDETQFTSQIKMELIQLQEEIDSLDMDNKLRTGKIEFMPAPITAMRKWLLLNTNTGKRELEKLQNNAIDIQKLIKALSVGSAEEGLQKLYKITSILDLFINKITEYEIIHLLRYDETYNSISKNAQQQSENTKFQMLSQGIDTKKFLPAQVSIERQVYMYQQCGKLQNNINNNNGNQEYAKQQQQQQLQQQQQEIFKFDEKGIQNKQDMSQYLNQIPIKYMSQDFKDKMSGFLNEGIQNEEKLKIQQSFIDSQNSSRPQSASKGPNLQKQIAQLQLQMREIEDDKNNVYLRVQNQINVIEKLKTQLRESEEKIADLTKNGVPQQISEQTEKPKQFDGQHYSRVIDETKEIYESKQRSLISENENLLEKINQKTLKVEQLQQQVTDSFQKEKDFGEWKKEFTAEFRKNFADAKGYQNSYEKALQLEFGRYKKAWERKIEDLEYEVENNKKQNARNLTDIRLKLKKEEETKSLLLKKLQCFV